MPIFDIFKKKKKPKEKPKEKVKEIKKPLEAKETPEVKVETKAPKESKLPTGQVKKKTKTEKISKIAYRILKEPHITEKATDLSQKNQYVFKVFSRANKTEIKKAIKDLYGVDVVGVTIINVPRKRRRLGRITGFRKGYKKAVVKLKEGQKIELLPR